MLDDTAVSKWKTYIKRKRELTEYGLKNGYIKTYDNKVIEKLRNIYYKGIPLSIWLLCDDLCDGNCYESAFLLTLGFDDNENFKLVVAEVDDIKLNPIYIEQFGVEDVSYSYHCFVEKTTTDGQTFVYDTSTGFMYEKDFYYKLENPKIISVSDKKKIFAYSGYDKLKSSKIEKNEYIKSYVLPSLEQFIYSSDSIYKDKLIEELKIFKDNLFNVSNIKNKTIKVLKKNNLTNM